MTSLRLDPPAASATPSLNARQRLYRARAARRATNGVPPPRRRSPGKIFDTGRRIGENRKPEVGE